MSCQCFSVRRRAGHAVRAALHLADVCRRGAGHHGGADHSGVHQRDVVRHPDAGRQHHRGRHHSDADHHRPDAGRAANPDAACRHRHRRHLVRGRRGSRAHCRGVRRGAQAAAAGHRLRRAWGHAYRTSSGRVRPGCDDRWVRYRRRPARTRSASRPDSRHAARRVHPADPEFDNFPRRGSGSRPANVFSDVRVCVFSSCDTFENAGDPGHPCGTRVDQLLPYGLGLVERTRALARGGGTFAG